MENLENDRREIFNLARPIIENYPKYKEHAFFIKVHVDNLKLVSESSWNIDKIFTTNTMIQVDQSEILHNIERALVSFNENHNSLLEDTDILKKKYEDSYNEYNKQLSKLNKLNVTNSSSSPSSKAEEQQVLLLVDKLQDYKAKLDLIASNVKLQLDGIGKKQEKAYKELCLGFKKSQELLYSRVLSHVKTLKTVRG